LTSGTELQFWTHSGLGDLVAGPPARSAVEESTMSLPGLVRHMAGVERGWFRRRFAGLGAPERD
jgi:Protein of unknown function (DUF664)